MYTFQLHVEQICITVMGCGEMFDAEDQGLVQMCNKSRHRQAEDLWRSFLKTADSTILGYNQEKCFPFFHLRRSVRQKNLNWKDGDWLFMFYIFIGPRSDHSLPMSVTH